MEKAATVASAQRKSASMKRYYENLHESLKLEIPAWEDLSTGCTRNLKIFLMELNALSRVDRNLLIECIRDCEKEIAARSTNGILDPKAIPESVREIISRSEKRRIHLESLLLKVFSFRGVHAKGKTETEKTAERENRETLRNQPALATA